MATCDLAVATETARFATPGVKVGLFWDHTDDCPVVGRGPKCALEMLFTGRMVSAAEALGWGLINRVVPEGELEDAVMGLAENIVSASPLVLGIGKRAL